MDGCRVPGRVRAVLAVGEGTFSTGITDLPPGGAAIASFRDPLRLNMDMLETVAEVKALLARVNAVNFHVYDTCYEKLTLGGVQGREHAQAMLRQVSEWR